MSVQKLEKQLEEYNVDRTKLIEVAGISEEAFLELYDVNIDDTVRMFTLARLEKALEGIVASKEKVTLEPRDITTKELEMLKEYRRLNDSSKMIIRRVISSEWAKQIWVES